MEDLQVKILLKNVITSCLYLVSLDKSLCVVLAEQ